MPKSRPDVSQARTAQPVTPDSPGRRGLLLSTARYPEARQPDRTLSQAIFWAKLGDHDAVRYLYVRYADEVHAYTRRILRDSTEAEDITQQVFAKLLSAIRRYEERDAPFGAWIIRVAHNLAVDHLRGRRAIPVADVRVSAASDELSPDRSECLRLAFASLPDDQRQVLVLRHVLGLTPPEIASRLDKTEASVHGLHHRGRAALKGALLDMGVAPATA
jgi:RNA polymerase sigma-70 factor (ECF subfamily)